MEHPEHTTSEFCNSTHNSCALLRVPVKHAALLLNRRVKKKPLSSCFLCGGRPTGRLRNIESTPGFAAGLSVVSMISQCWDIHIIPVDEDGRRIKCCVKCIAAIKRSFSIKKELEDYVINVQGGVPYSSDTTLESYPYCLNPSSQEDLLKQELEDDFPDDDLLYTENDPSAVYHDVEIEHGYQKDTSAKLPPKNHGDHLKRSSQLTPEDTKKNDKSKHIAKSASAKSTPRQQIHPIRTPDLPTPEKRQQSSQPTEKATKTNINSECMYSVETTLEEQVQSLGTETSQLIKRLITPRPMNIEERNKLLDILGDRTSNENLVAQTIFRCKSLMESLRACIVADINDMAKKITSTTCQPGPSVLRWMAGDDILQHKDLMFKAVLELKTVFPIAFEVLMTLCNPPHLEKRYALPTMAMIYGMAMHTRNKDMSAIQRISTCVVTRYNPGGELLQIFNKFALTFANSCTLGRLIHQLDVLDMEEAMANADAKARNDVGSTLSADQKQDVGDNSNHTVSAESTKNPPEFSFLSDAAESCIKEMFNDRLRKNREKERSREIRQLQKAEKKKRRGTKVGNCPGKDLLTKTHLKKRRTSPHSNIALSGRKRRQVILQIRRADEENDQIEASQNPGQTGLVGRVIDTSNRSGEHSVTEYTIVKNADEDSSSEVGENSMIDYAEVKNTDINTSSEDGENSMIDYTIVKNIDVDYSSEDGENSMIDYTKVKNTDTDTSSEDGENSVTDYAIVKNTDVEMEDETNEQPLCYIPDFHIPDFPVK